MPHYGLPNDLEPNTYARRRGGNIEGAREGRVVYRVTVVVTRGFWWAGRACHTRRVWLKTVVWQAWRLCCVVLLLRARYP